MKNTSKNLNIINKVEEDNEIIIEVELEIYNDEVDKEINILCDKNKLSKDNKDIENDIKENNLNIIPPKEFNYFNKGNTKLYLNDKEIEFNYKLKLNNKGIYKILIKSNVKLFSLSTIFYNCLNINKINFIKINTNNVTDMSCMFSNCYNLSKIELSSFNTKNVTNMMGMFADCYNLSELDLSSFNTKNVTNMFAMFSGCYNLSKLDLSSFIIKNVTNMMGMFSSCSKISELDLSSFEINNDTHIRGMFGNFLLNEILINKINIKKIKEKNVIDIEIFKI